MKNIKILIMLIMFPLVAFGNDKEFNFDFDGKNIKSQQIDFVRFNKLNLIDLSENDLFIPYPKITQESEKNVTLKLKLLNKKYLDNLLREDFDSFKDFQKIIRDNKEKKIFIIYSDTKIYLATEISENKYNVIYESNDCNFVKKISSIFLSNPDKGWITVCKEILTWVSLIKDGVEVGYWVTKQICELVEKPVDSGTGNPAGSGSTWHNGQGGDSIYDVNKKL